MTIGKTIGRLNVLAELTRETIAEDMSETHMIAVDAEDLEALRKAVIVLECVRVTSGVFDKEGAE